MNLPTPTFKITGPVHGISKNIERVSNDGKGYKMTEVYLRFVDEYNGNVKENLMKFTFFGKAMEFANAASVGDLVEIEYQISGKVVNSNNKRTHFQNLNGRTFKFPETTKPEPQGGTPKITVPSGDDYLSPDDDLPF